MGAKSFANVSLHSPLTLLAGDVAAPVVLAVAAFDHLLGVWIVAPATAHQVTTVTATGRLIALSGTEIEEKRRRERREERFNMKATITMERWSI